MKLYSSAGPNADVVRMFMAERGIEIPTETVDIMAAANRQEPYLQVNPRGQLPALILEDSTTITEITAICEYLDETHPGESLIGSTPEERAQTRRWTRWADLNVTEPLTTAFRGAEGLALFEKRMRCLPEAAAGLKQVVRDNLQWLEANWDSRRWLAGNRFSLADINLYAFLSFGNRVGQPLDAQLQELTGWMQRVGGRPSAEQIAT